MSDDYTFRFRKTDPLWTYAIDDHDTKDFKDLRIKLFFDYCNFIETLWYEYKKMWIRVLLK